MYQERKDEGFRVQIDLYPYRTAEDDAQALTYEKMISYRVSCMLFAFDENNKRIPPTTVISLLGLSQRPTPADIRGHAAELVEVAEVAEALQSEMTERYIREYGN